MDFPADRAAERRFDALDSVLVGVLAVLIVSTAAALLIPGLIVSVQAVGLDLLIDVVTALVTITVASLMWARYRERGDPTALVQSGAFVVLAIANSIAVVLGVTHLDASVAVAGMLPGQAPMYVASVAHLLAAGLLVVGLLTALRGATAGHPWATLAAPVAGFLLVLALLQLFGQDMPPLSSAFVAAGPLPVSTGVGWVIGGLSAALFLLAAGLSRRVYRRSGSSGDAYLAVGLVFAGFAQFHLALSPATFVGLVSGGDLLRISFDVVLLLGIRAEAAAAMADLRNANANLVRLKDAEADRSALEERARLARELHDGLSQDLWLAKLKVGRLAALPDLEPEVAALSGELGDAIDAGLADARQAVIALRSAGDAETTLSDQLSRYVDDFADRCGLRAEFTCEVELPRLAPRAEAELLRIAQEALNNIHRHADATFVRVKAAIEDGQLRLGVLDNGRGFDPAVVGDSAFGLASMRERAGLIGGRLTIDSRPRDGTAVWVDVPLAVAVAIRPSAPR